MIQRIQTIFLLLAAALTASLFFVPLWKQCCLFVYIERHCVITICVVAASLLPLVIVFLYQRRMLQIRLCMVNALILIGCQGLIAYYFLSTEMTATLCVPSVFPLVAAILTLIAARYIKRDENLVRAADRLR